MLLHSMSRSRLYRDVEANFPFGFLSNLRCFFKIFTIFLGYRREVTSNELEFIHEFVTASMMTSISTYFYTEVKNVKNADYAYLGLRFFSVFLGHILTILMGYLTPLVRSF